MHTLLIFLMGVLILSAVIVIICHVNDENLTPVGKTFSSLFIGCCAVVLSIQVLLDHPARFELSSVQPVGVAAALVPVDAGQAVVTSRPAVNQVTPGTAQVSAPAAVAVSAVQPGGDSSTKDMLLGGALGYMLGSSGHQSAAPGIQSVTNHTTVINSPPPSVPSTRVAATSAVRPVSPSNTFGTFASTPKAAPSAPSFSYRSTFSMTRSGRR